jgi:spermidine synthase
MAWLFSATILLSSCLLFLVQPLCAKMLLPYLGGTPAVWNTCMVFFQAGLLLGYAYAHYVPRWLGIRWHALVHLAALVLAFFLLPIEFPSAMNDRVHPVLWLLEVLTLQVGLPFVLMASGAPLLQSWFVCKTRGLPRDPYFLYAASNFGSFLALGLYPLVLEPNWSVIELNNAWRFGFLVLIGLMTLCAPLRGQFGQHPEPVCTPVPIPDRWTRARWVVLALIPSSLLLSVTTCLTTDIAAIPLFWVIPLGIYLITLTLAFAPRSLVPRGLLIRGLPLVVLVLAIVMLSEASEPMLLVAGLHLIGLFWLAMLCHGELARTRPALDHLTAFYLCVAGGGVLGGVFSALVAPLVFPGLAEYPLMIVLACYFGLNSARPTRVDVVWAGGLGLLALFLVLLAPAQLNIEAGPIAVAAIFGVPLLLCYLTRAPARMALSFGAVLLASALYPGIHGTAAYRERSFYGIHRVTTVDGFHRLVHGNIIHGQQSVNPARAREPLTYYAKSGPIGEVFKVFRSDPRLQHVGVVGLGTGSLAAYARRGQQWTFFELDPSVQRIAENPKLFTYLHDARATANAEVRIELGDARLQLQKSTQRFGLLIVDAFGSDAIPVHLLTLEALQMYRAHQPDDGILAFHISNNFVDFEPVLAALAENAQPSLVCYIRDDHAPTQAEKDQGVFRSIWVVMAQNTANLDPLLRDHAWRRAKARPGAKPWTDAFSNLLQVLRWRAGE